MPCQAGVPSGSMICVAPGCRPISAVSGFSMSVSRTEVEASGQIKRSVRGDRFLQSLGVIGHAVALRAEIVNVTQVLQSGRLGRSVGTAAAVWKRMSPQRRSEFEEPPRGRHNAVRGRRF